MSAYTIALPVERFEQLKRFADNQSTTMSDVVSHFLDAAARAGKIPNELPGWRVEREEEDVIFSHPEAGLTKRMSRREAVSLGETLRHAGNREEKFGAQLDLDVMLAVFRRGNGVRLRDARTHAERTVALNVAADLGRRLIRAAA